MKISFLFVLELRALQNASKQSKDFSGLINILISNSFIGEKHVGYFSNSSTSFELKAVPFYCAFSVMVGET